MEMIAILLLGASLTALGFVMVPKLRARDYDSTDIDTLLDFAEMVPATKIRHNFHGYDKGVVVLIGKLKIVLKPKISLVYADGVLHYVTARQRRRAQSVAMEKIRDQLDTHVSLVLALPPHEEEVQL